VEFTEPWSRIDDADFQRAVEEELRREVPDGHILAGMEIQAIARRHDRDDVLVALPGSRWAVIHLTWRGNRERDARWPTAELLMSEEELTARLRADTEDFR
jgi:hypothetical protein